MVNLVGKKSSVSGLKASAPIEESTAGASVPRTLTAPVPAPTVAIEAPKGQTATDLTALVAAALESVTSLPGGEALVASLLLVVAPSAVVALIGFGVRDENEMTNLVFWARYPAMAGKEIARSDTTHSQAWLDARDMIVRPAIKAAASDGSKQAAAKITGAKPTTTPEATGKPVQTPPRPEVAVPQVAASDRPPWLRRLKPEPPSAASRWLLTPPDPSSRFRSSPARPASTAGITGRSASSTASCERASPCPSARAFRPSSSGRASASKGSWPATPS